MVGKKVNYSNHCRKQHGDFQGEKKQYILYMIPAISILDIFPKDGNTLHQRDTSHTMLTDNSTVCNNQNMESNHVSIIKWGDKENFAYTQWNINQ